MLEDGAEQGNTFERNVGAVGHGVDIRISDNHTVRKDYFWLSYVIFVCNIDLSYILV